MALRALSEANDLEPSPTEAWPIFKLKILSTASSSFEWTCRYGTMLKDSDSFLWNTVNADQFVEMA